MIGKLLSHYQIERKLGSGGMGEVYLALDTKLDREVAIKVLPPDFASDPSRMRRFNQEAKAASAVKHSNVAHIYDIGETDGVHFIAMEYIEGETLAEHLQKKELEISEILEIAIQLTDALSEAHARGIIHRDIKPANLVMTPRGQLKILDFGIAKISHTATGESETQTPTQSGTAPGIAVGTVHYMSPEQALGKTVDSRTDLFAVGVMLYQLLTKRLPFTGANSLETLDRILHEVPEPIARFNYQVPPELERIVRKCMEKNSDDRYQSARDLLVDLKNLRRDTLAGTVRTAQPAPTKKLFQSSQVIGTLALLGLVVAGIVAAQFLKKISFAKESRIRSIAVLPFENTSRNPDTEYLSDGITESLINNLSQISDLTVISRASAFRYKGKPIEPRAIADELKVQAILTGRVVQRGDQLSISAELLDAGHDKHLWGEQYNQNLSDVMAVQEQITKMIVANLKSQITGQQQKQIAKQHTSDPLAYQLYLKGRFYWNQATEESTKKAIQYFNDAIAKDPAYAMAYAGLADCYGLVLGDFYWPPKEAVPKGKAAALRALELNDELAEPHTTLGVIHMFFDYQWEEAEKEFKRSIELNPGYATAHHQLAWSYALRGRFEESKRAFDRAVELDPLSTVIVNDRNVPYAFSGNYKEAIRLCQKAIEMDPNFFLSHFALGWNYAMAEQFDEAFKELEIANRLSPSPMNVSWLGYVEARRGKRAEALQYLNALQTASKERYVPPYNIAVIHAGLQDHDSALEWLEKGFQERDGWLIFLKQEKAWLPLHPDPRFQDLLRRVGFK